VKSLPLVAAGFLGLLAARALASEATPAEVGWTVLFLLGWVLLPGLALWRVLRTRALDPVGELALGGALGTGLLILGFFALRELGWLSLLFGWPLAAAPLLWAARRRAPVPPDGAPGTSGPALAALGLCVTMLLVGTPHAAPSRWWLRFNNDDQFHAGNAAEVLRPPPLRDPRVAGLPLNYHAFSYALPAGLRLVSGAPIAHASLLLLAGFGPALLALLVHTGARSLARDAWAGVGAAGFLSLHADLGAALRMLDIKEARRLGFGSALSTGVTDSLPTCTGLLFAAALFLLLHHRLADGGGARTLAGLVFVAFVASGTKGSVMPVVLAGLALAWLAATIRGRAPAGLGSAVLAMALAALPATLRLALGEQSYARAMFELDPLGTLYRSGFVKALGGEDPGFGARLALLLPWLAGYLGPSGWLAVAWLARRRGAMEAALGWIAAAGLGAALALRAPGASELFFAYTGQIAMIMLAGRSLSGDGALPPRARAALLLVGLPFLCAGVVRAGHVVGLEWRDRLPEPPRLAAWREGLTWLREHAEPEALVASRGGTMFVPVFTERRSLFDLASFTPQQHAGDTGPKPFAEHRTALRRLYAAPDAFTLALVKSLAPDASVLYAVCDAARAVDAGSLGVRWKVDPRPECPALAGAPGFEPVFTNSVLTVFRARLP
jgi:hypothetical protein